MATRPLTVRLFLTLIIGLCVSLTPGIAKKKPPLKPVNLNTANAEELQQVPGIGPATAEKILQMRKSYGAFKSVDDLLSIRGIGKKRLDKMRKYLAVSKSTAVNKPARPPASHPPNKPEPASSTPQAIEAEEPPLY